MRNTCKVIQLCKGDQLAVFARLSKKRKFIVHVTDTRKTVKQGLAYPNIFGYRLGYYIQGTFTGYPDKNGKLEDWRQRFQQGCLNERIYKTKVNSLAVLGCRDCREKKLPNCHKYATFWGGFFNFLWAKIFFKKFLKTFQRPH